ncbi:L-methionine/branched-chain amino acid transporter [Shewanella dokdonensis]|uniref:L-methionine/branched-chain amino acid transporter n=1 Tax=Shewanella dokdonensis TaxID=712036 RepID=A0ABX8DKE2_9GAMM|nr:L-methionine/branched-chain amino acid transporter [Shewanella dokdonensis]MCL1075696.1 L-methionine/branched-chain amino acid transporter [Shewanella dokdonensis]QVK24815.1 L-methionine/branched-chain amino acid transporter [Shewanella dokdonensis]
MNPTSGTIGRWQGAGLMATTLLGTGVFILPQMTVNMAGHGAMLAWALLTLAIIPITVVFAQLGAHFPHAAGPAFFVEKAFGRVVGRAVGLSFLLIVPIGAPAAIMMTFQFFQAMVPISGWGQLACELMVLLVLLGLNLRGIQVSAKAQFTLTLCIVAVVVLMFGSGVSHAAQYQQPEAALNSHGIMQAMGIAFWSFLGVEAMTHLTADFRNPRTDFIPAMMIGTLLVGAIYLACTWVLLLAPSAAPLAMMGAFDRLLGGYGTQVIGILGIASGLATTNVYAASVARLLSSFSEQGITPRWFAPRNQYQVPVRALVMMLSLMALVLLTNFLTDTRLDQLISWANGVFVVIYLLSMLAAIRLLSKRYRLWAWLSSLMCLLLGVALATAMAYAIILMLVLLPLLWLQMKLRRPPLPPITTA